MPLSIWQGNIAECPVDIIVNAANSQLMDGGGVSGAIHQAVRNATRNFADRTLFRDEQDAIMGKTTLVPVGESRITHAPGLHADYVIHTVGPKYDPTRPRTHALQDQEIQLHMAYRSALAIFEGTRCNSIAFPVISAGIYGYPKPDAARVCVGTLKGFLRQHRDRDVRIAVFNDPVMLSHLQELLK